MLVSFKIVAPLKASSSKRITSDKSSSIAVMPPLVGEQPLNAYTPIVVGFDLQTKTSKPFEPLKISLSKLERPEPIYAFVIVELPNVPFLSPPAIEVTLSGT